MFVLGIARRIYTSLACARHTVAQLVSQTIDWSKQPRALPHFTDGHIFCLLFISHYLCSSEIFITLFISIAQQCLLP